MILACEAMRWLYVQLPLAVHTPAEQNTNQEKKRTEAWPKNTPIERDTHMSYWCTHLPHAAPNTAISNQSRIKVHTHARTHTHCFPSSASRVRPDLYSVCSDISPTSPDSAEIQAYGNAHTHTRGGKTPSNSQETELVLEFSPKRPWMTSVV